GDLLPLLAHRLGDHAVFRVDELHDFERIELVDTHAAWVPLLREPGFRRSSRSHVPPGMENHTEKLAKLMCGDNLTTPGYSAGGECSNAFTATPALGAGRLRRADQERAGQSIANRRPPESTGGSDGR